MKEKKGKRGFREHALMYTRPEEFECRGVVVKYVPLSMKRMLELKQSEAKRGAKVDPIELCVELKQIQTQLEAGNVDVAAAGVAQLLAAAEQWQAGFADDLLAAILAESELLIANWAEIREEALEAWTPAEHRYVNMVIYMAALQNSTVQAMDRAVQLMKEADGNVALKKSFGPKVEMLLQSIPPLRLRFSSEGATGKPKSSTGPSPSTTAGSNA